MLNSYEVQTTGKMTCVLREQLNFDYIFFLYNALTLTYTLNILSLRFPSPSYSEGSVYPK